MFCGSLRLDHSSEEGDISYKANITDFIRKGNKVSFDFEGNDGVEGLFFGHCNAVADADVYKGEGEFKYPDGSIYKAQGNYSAWY